MPETERIPKCLTKFNSLVRVYATASTIAVGFEVFFFAFGINAERATLFENKWEQSILIRNLFEFGFFFAFATLHDRISRLNAF